MKRATFARTDVLCYSRSERAVPFDDELNEGILSAMHFCQTCRVPWQSGTLFCFICLRAMTTKAIRYEIELLPYEERAFDCSKKYGYGIADIISFGTEKGRQRMVDASHQRLNVGPISIRDAYDVSRPRAAKLTPAASVPWTEGRRPY